MTLHFIGIGLDNEKDISIKGLELVKQADFVYLESYTAKLNCSAMNLAKFYNKQIILAHREMVEGDSNEILENAKTREVAFLVVGDPFSATTHLDLMQRAKKEKIKVTITNNASIITAIGISGLQLYKFGKITSVPYPQQNFAPETAYDTIKMNQTIGLHTLLLLDVQAERNAYMTVNEAIHILWQIEKKRKEEIFTDDTFCIGCARLGSSDAIIKAGNASVIVKHNFGSPLHCLIVPGKMHFMEENALKEFIL